jgi:hypothetical protein
MRVFKLLESNEEIQLEATFVQESDYDATAIELNRQSTETANKSRIYLSGKLDGDIEDDVVEIVKCEGIYNTRNRYEDKEINDYLNSQDQQAKLLKDKIRRLLIQSFEKGEFIFRGANKPVKSYGSKFREATNAKLKKVAETVFDKYNQASISVQGSDTEKLLNFKDYRTLSTALNYFDIVKSDGSIDLNHAAIKSIQEFIDREGQAEGKKLLEYFDAAPYGWSKDTTRYLIALMFIASDIKLRISGEDIKVKGPKAVEALKNVNGFNRIGISGYDKADKPTMPMLALSVKRLAELTGESVAPLQDKIAEVVRRHFPVFQTRFSAIKTELDNLGLPGKDRAQDVQDGIEEILKGEGSDAAFKLGKEESDLYLDLKWIRRVFETFESGIKKDFALANDLKRAIAELPDSGIPLEIKNSTQENFGIIEEIMLDEEFVDRIPDLKDAISNIESLISDYCQKLLNSENENIQFEIDKIRNSPNWGSLSKEQKQALNYRLDGLFIQDKQGIDGIKEILNSTYGLNNTIRTVNEQIEEYIKEKPQPSPGKKAKVINLSGLPKHIESAADLDEIIKKLEELKKQLKDDETIELNW